MKENKIKMSQAKKPKRAREVLTSSEDDDDPAPIPLADSSEYSEEVEEDLNSPYPFVDKEPEVGDFVLVELQLQEGRFVGTNVHYVGKILAVGEHGRFSVSFLRVSSVFLRDSFRFPIIEDISEVDRSCCKGVLATVTGNTQRLSNIVRILPPLHSFNIR